MAKKNRTLEENTLRAKIQELLQVSNISSRRRVENELPTEKIKQIHAKSPDKGYRRIVLLSSGTGTIYYGRCFTSKQSLVKMIESHINYYNTRRVQRNLGVLMPMEKHNLTLAV